MAAPTDQEPLEELSLARHRDLEGRHWGFAVWLRRAITAVLLAFVLLAAFNQLGQQPSSQSSSSDAVELRVSTPSRLRGGLIFQTRIDVTARRTLSHPTVVLNGDWFDGMTLNSANPAPAEQARADDNGSTFTYDELPSGRTLTMWLEWSVNPNTLAWSRPLTVQVRDGSETLVSQTSSLTVLP